MSLIQLQDHSSSRTESFPPTELNLSKCQMSTCLHAGSVFQFWSSFACIWINEFVASFDSTLLASSHPVIASFFHSSDSAAWLSTSFLITSTAFMPLFAPLSDIWGRKVLWLAATSTTGIALALCGLAPNLGTFLAGRALCGLGAGGAESLGSILLNDLVSMDVRGRYQSILNLAFGIGGALGAAMGGFLSDHLGWRWMFGIQVPVILAVAVMSYLVIPEDPDSELWKSPTHGLWGFTKDFDLQGSVLLPISLTSLIAYLNLGGIVLPWSHPLLLAVLLTFAVTALLFVQAQAHAKRPILPLMFLASWPRANIVFSNFLMALITSATLFNAPLYFEVVKADLPTVAGFRLIVPSIALMTTGLLSGFMVSDERWLPYTMKSGILLTLLGSCGLCFMDKKTNIWSSAIILSLTLAGQGMLFPASYIAMLRTSRSRDYALATSALFLLRRLGSVLGVALSALVVQNTLVHYLKQKITGEQKQEIITSVLKSVHTIYRFTLEHKREVVAAYTIPLRISFGIIGLCAFAMVAVAIPFHLPGGTLPEETFELLVVGDLEDRN